MFEELARKARAAYLQHVRPELLRLALRPYPINDAELQALRMNSYEQELVWENLEDQALVNCIEHCLANCGTTNIRRPCSTYDEALANVWVPLLLSRLAALTKVKTCHAEPRPQLMWLTAGSGKI